MIAISPDRPEKLIESRKSSSIGFALYSDSPLNAASAMGIAFQLDEETRTRYLGFGIDLEEVSGEGHGQLPVPSVFLVSAGGEILWVYSNPDYKVRPENAALLKAARRATTSTNGAASDQGK